MSTKAQREADEQVRAEYLDELRSALPAGATVYTVVRHVSSSGMSRAISFHYIDGGDLRWVDMHRALGLKLHRTERGYAVTGAGMDMAWYTVYNLSTALHGDGYALAQRAL